MTPLLTVDRLKNELQYDRITSRVEPGQAGFMEVHPEDESLPNISWGFDPGFTYLDTFGFGVSHWHLDNIHDRVRRVEASIRMARKFMRHSLCTLEYLRANGERGGAGMYGPRGIPRIVNKGDVQFRRWFFGLPGVVEPIDYSRYIEEELLYVEKRFKARVEWFQRRNEAMGL